MNKTKTQTMVRFSILLALLAVFCFTPLGSLPSIGGIVMTLAMVPVILTALTMGTKAGTLMGFFAGLFSFLVWTFMPPTPITAFVFTPFYSLGEFSGNFGSLLICFVPRILVGTVTGLAYSGFSKLFKGKSALACGIAGLLGSLTNTVGVMGGIWLFFGNQYASIAGQAMLAVIGVTVLTNGLPEAVLSFVTGTAVGWPLRRALGVKAA